MYVIALSFPAMIVGVRGGSFSYHCWRSINWSSLAAWIDVEVLPLYVHATDNILSQKLPVCLNCRSPTTYSSTSHPRTNPASLISFIVNIHFGFVWDTSSFLISYGHLYWNTQVCMLWGPGLIAPTDHNWHSFVYCKLSGYSLPSICTGVGISARWCTNIPQSFSAATGYGVIFT